MRYASTTSGAETSVIRLLSAAVAVGFLCSHYVENANRIFITVTSVLLFVKSPYVGLWIIDPIYVYPGYGHRGLQNKHQLVAPHHLRRPHIPYCM